MYGKEVVSTMSNDLRTVHALPSRFGSQKQRHLQSTSHVLLKAQCLGLSFGCIHTLRIEPAEAERFLCATDTAGVTYGSLHRAPPRIL
jgi:hypothetical protein